MRSCNSRPQTDRTTKSDGLNARERSDAAGTLARTGQITTIENSRPNPSVLKTEPAIFLEPSQNRW